MALRSMTGFGSAEKTTPIGSFHVEIRAVNNRYLEMQLRTPKALSICEPRIKKLVSENISRGSVSVIVNWERDGQTSRLTWDRSTVGNYVTILREIQKEFSLSGDLSLTNLLSFSDVVKLQSDEHSEEIIWKNVFPVFTDAISSFQKSREQEARALLKDLKKMAAEISRLLVHIKKRAPLRLKEYTAASRKRMETLAATVIEPTRLMSEAALLADRLDISEECTRLGAHLEKFLSDCDSGEPVGKRMNFILQEMNRESNTIASKANDTIIAHMSVSLRETIEKIREQIQNIE